ncbi:MAG: MG2 domain-containing protein [Candidatus Sumerlaeota bacterium]|nr:MG2 domain-containing protein [Candidatus Sumerlaeota bacterium]
MFHLSSNRRRFLHFGVALCVIALIMSAGFGLLTALSIPAQEANESMANTRKKAEKLNKDGNHKEAFEVYKKLLLDPQNGGALCGNDLAMVNSCLLSLNRAGEIDALREEAIKIHKDDWRFLMAAAQSYRDIEHNGFIIAGEFQRGQHRGGGRPANAFERDRIRGLQLMLQGMPLAIEAAKKEAARSEASQFFEEFARDFLMGRFGQTDSWRLQSLTDIATLPDYEEGNYYNWYYRGSETRGAPVDANGDPIFYRIPKSFESAQSDGERWRWMLMQAMEMSPGSATRIRYEFASFLSQQFGVQTMASYSYFWGRQTDDTSKDESGTYALHTLKDSETIARLAAGIKRFKLPDEFNFISIFTDIAKTDKNYYGRESLKRLAENYENRRQYPRAAEYWKELMTRIGNSDKNEYKQAENRFKQITNAWGEFEMIQTQPAGEAAALDYRFRNGKKVEFEAFEIKVNALLVDVKNFIRTKPRMLDWQKINIQDIGQRLVYNNEDKYIGAKVDSWSLPVEPRLNHFDKRVTVKTPLKKAGAYLVVAKMEDGNVSRIILWLNDTVIVKKQMDKKAWLFVADARTGAPVAKANVEFFGYKQEYLKNNDYRIDIAQFADSTDGDGQVFPDPKDAPNSYQWIITATNDDGRFAYLGFTGIWRATWYDNEYNATKVFTITDRPVYRPGQKVKFKFWVRHAKYDEEDSSSFANQSFAIEIRNPKNDKILEKRFTADAYGGFDGEIELAKDATLGVYHLFIPSIGGGGNFRVEEYKKPEFEVNVEAPTEPVMLGEKITATIKGKYYFGEPVKKAKVKYKVMRSSHSAYWYPIGLWDWFYGSGYWWYAYDYVWYPGWTKWGCFRPIPWWWSRPSPQPEVVLENEVPIGADGTVKVEIDTALAKLIHGDQDHRYEITAEVTDESRRTITGTGQVLVARQPFKVYAWVNRGHYRVGDTIEANFRAQTLDNKPVQGRGDLNLYKIAYDKDMKPVEKSVQDWRLDTNVEGMSSVQIDAKTAGQYRLAYKVRDSKKHEIEGGYVFTVTGDGDDGSNYRFNAVELVTDKREYAPGDKVKLRINTEQKNSTVLLFIRPANGVYLLPKVLRLKGKSTVEEIEISKKDMPNFFVEALTIAGNRVHSETREVIVPPESRILKMEVETAKQEYKPGDKAKIGVRLLGTDGKPFIGSTVMTVYDKALEYISGGSNVPEIKEFFWKWRRHHYTQTESNIERWFGNLLKKNEIAMSALGIFGASVATEVTDELNGRFGLGGGRAGGARLREANGIELSKSMAYSRGALAMDAMPMASAAMPAPPGASMMTAKRKDAGDKEEKPSAGEGPGEGGAEVTPMIRSKFADAAFWAAALTTDKDGKAEIEMTMPDNLTGWKVKAWAMGHGTKVAQAETVITTKKNLMLRQQAPRFFVEKDEVVLSANVHNYLKSKKTVRVVLELDGGCIEPMDKNKIVQKISVAADGEERVDWRVKVVKEGEAVVRMKALTDEESDAMEQKFPVYVHGMDKMVSFSGYIRPDKERGTLTLEVPKDRRVDESRLEIRYSPTLAAAMVDALPYLADYPYGCTEQTLSRFLPTVITQNVLKRMNLNLKDIKEKRSNLNAQEIGDDKARAEQWKRYRNSDGSYKNPVFDEEEVARMVKEGVKSLTEMQLSDGGWGWFSGYAEHSWPHTTAYVVHGLQIARENDVALVPGVLERGVEWLKNYQDRELQKLKNWEASKDKEKKIEPYKVRADDLDAFVYMTLADAGKENAEMREFIYRDRNDLAVYSKAMFGMALHKQNHVEQRDMIMRNIEQFLQKDDENQTAYLNLGNNGYWWYWYGSEYEAHAYYLKLLARTGDVKDWKAPYLVKYLLNNRKHATYWKCTRDTAIVVEAFADYIKASGEDKPDLTVEIIVDGKKQKEVKINSENLFTYDNKFVMFGDAVETGKHVVELRKQGTGPLYFNAYLSYFSLEDFITKAGLEVKVERQVYKLKEVDKKIKVASSRGQAVDQKVEKYERILIKSDDTLKSGDLMEIELVIESKNDYEYLVFEDMKAAGCEPVEVRSGYTGNDMGAYVEYRDNRVAFFVRSLARGKHSVSYRIRAEIPGRFSALPSRGFAMYAPELRGNSDEIKLRIEDK